MSLQYALDVVAVSSVAGAVIGAAASIFVSLLAFVYGYGKLSQQVANLSRTVEVLKNDIGDRLRALEETLVEVRERVAKLETAVERDLPPPLPQT